MCGALLSGGVPDVDAGAVLAGRAPLNEVVLFAARPNEKIAREHGIDLPS